METILLILLAMAMIGVLSVLASGIVGFVVGGDFNKKHANKLMRLRVGTQALAVFLLLILLLVRGSLN